MTFTFILAQICGLFMILSNVIGIQFKKKSIIVFFQVLTNVFSVAQYFLLGAFTGAAISIINTIRSFTFFALAQKGKRPKFELLFLFEFLTLLTGLITWQSAWSLIPIIMSMTFTYGLWQENVLVIKIISCTTGAGWVVYSIATKAFLAAVQQTLQAISAFIAIIRLRIDNKRQPMTIIINIMKNKD